MSLFTHEMDLGRAEVLAKTEQSICWASRDVQACGRRTIPMVAFAFANPVDEPVALTMCQRRVDAIDDRES